MKSILSTILTKKAYVFAVFVIALFLLARTFLLQKPNTELTYTIQREDLVDSVQVSGTYTTASQVPILSPTDGIIDKLFVQNGNEIKKGTPLFHVESTATADQRKLAYANYLAAKAVVDADNAKLHTLQSIMFQANQVFVNDKGVLNPTDTQKIDPKYVQENADWLAAEANYKNQQGVIAKDQAALSSALQLYNETKSVTVTAPIDGIVVNLLAKVGDQTTATQPLLMIANLGNPYISASVNEDDATRVESGQKTMIVFDALKERTFSGVVDTVATVGTNSQGIVSYAARIMTDSLPKSIKPNMTALITIETLRKDNVIDVPNTAIFLKDEKTYVKEAKTHALIEVGLGIKGLAKTEIVSGLSEGEVIVASPT